MDVLEKKLSSAIRQLIAEVTKLHPNLKRPLAKIQTVLTKIDE